MKNSRFTQIGLFVHLLSFLHYETVLINYFFLSQIFLSQIFVYVNYFFQELATCLQFLLDLIFLKILNSYFLVPPS